MKKFAYFPGCSLKTTGKEFDLSVKEVSKKLDIDLWEIPDWNCCGSSSAHLSNPYLAWALPARNMAKADEAGLDVIIPCAACFSHSRKAQMLAQANGKEKAIIDEIIGRDYKGESKALSALEAFSDNFTTDELKAKMVKSLSGLKVVCYYGCLLTRPSELACDDIENPQKMDRIMHDLGAEVLEWNSKTVCCGASHSASADALMGLEIIDKILLDAQKAGADCIVTACPMCMSNLDMRQKECANKLNRNYNLPIYYFSELMGIALGVEPKKMATNTHFVEAVSLLSKIDNKKEGEQ